MNHNKHWLNARRINFLNKLKIAIAPRNNVGPTLAQRSDWHMQGLFINVGPTILPTKCQLWSNECLVSEIFVQMNLCTLNKRLSRFPRGDKSGRVKKLSFLSLDSLVCDKFVEFRPVYGWKKFNFVQIMIHAFFKKSENKLITLKNSRITGPISTNTNFLDKKKS